MRAYALAARSTIHILDIDVRTTTDTLGRYKLTGMAKGEGYKIMAVPGSDQPYVVSAWDVPNSPGVEPVTVDVELKRGVWIEGRITDKVTGKAVQGSLEYFSLYSNPNLRDYAGFDGAIAFNFVQTNKGTNEDGSFRVVGLPGPGLVAVLHGEHYLRATERDDEYGPKETSLSTAPYHISFVENYSALARVDPAKGVDSVKRDVTLDPGWTFTGTVLGPEGKPLAGARAFGATNWVPPWGRDAKRTAEFTVPAFNPRRPRDVFFRHPEKGLVGVARPPKENGGSITVQMEAGATITGRLVDADGRPRAGVELKVAFSPQKKESWWSYSHEHIETDREGRFRIEALLPGYEFRIADDNGEFPLAGALHRGETKDLGDVKIKGEKD